MTEERVRELLRGMRDEPVPEESLERVREAVARRTRRRWWAGWRGAAMLATAAGVVVMVAVSWRAERAPAPVVAPRVAVLEQAAPPAVEPRREEPKAGHRREKPAVRKAPEVVVRIETPDPDVVILLVGG